MSTIGKDGKCTVCGTQVAAGIGETYYTDVKSALDAAADGQTVRLLANGMLPRDIYASKTLTLDLNGHSLSGYSLNVGGLTATSQIRTGNLTVIDSSGGNVTLSCHGGFHQGSRSKTDRNCRAENPYHQLCQDP